MSAITIEAPSAKDVNDLMQGLFGLDVKKVDVPDAEIHSIAEYVDDDGNAVGFLAFDLAGGCRLGAALTQVPAGRVDEAIAESAIPENLAENLDEVFNISVNLITPEEGGRMVLGRSAHGASAEHHAALIEALGQREQTKYGFDVTRYGVCSLTIGS